MNSLLDHILVASLIAGAMLYFVIGFVKRRASGKACGSGCCTTAKPPLKVRDS
jgi:hypothetical protein